jgi:hypothetical protein
MLAVLDELGLTHLVTTIPGLSAIGAAAILAQTEFESALNAFAGLFYFGNYLGLMNKPPGRFG